MRNVAFLQGAGQIVAQVTPQGAMIHRPSSGEVIDDHGQPPAERPSLRCRERQPGCPGIDLGEASILDAELFAEQLDLLLDLVVLAGEPDSGVDAVGSPTAGHYNGVMGQGDDVQNRGLEEIRDATLFPRDRPHGFCHV